MRGEKEIPGLRGRAELSRRIPLLNLKRSRLCASLLQLLNKGCQRRAERLARSAANRASAGEERKGDRTSDDLLLYFLEFFPHLLQDLLQSRGETAVKRQLSQVTAPSLNFYSRL